MEFRKLIRFGNSSYVVSLPKKWVKKNKLKKGDVIFVDENTQGDLLFSPKEITEEAPKTYFIGISDLDFKKIKREVSSAYINNYQYYELKSEKPIEEPVQLKEMLTSFIGVEVMEETKNRILVKDFVDLKTLSIEELLKKMHLLFSSMFDDLKNFKMMNLDSREKEIDKIFFLVRKLVFYNLNNPAMMKINKKVTSDFLVLRDIAFDIEALGDELKYLSTLFETFKQDQIAPDYFDLLEEIYSYYDTAMNIFFSHDPNSAIELSEKKSQLYQKINKTFERIKLPLKSEKLTFEAGVIKLHFTRIVSTIHQILRTVYTYPPSINKKK